MPSRGSLLSTTILSGVAAGALMPLGAQAADVFAKAPLASADAPLQGGAAVDGMNGKIDAFGGTVANRNIGGVGGSWSVPLQGQYGAQLDGRLGNFDSKMFATVGGHLFWRDPSRGLIGLYANHTYWNQFSGVNATQIAGEGEYYFGRWTLQGIAGVEFGNSSSRITPIAGGTLTETFDIRTRFFDQINVGYYVTDNWKAFIGHRYLGGKNALALGTEYAFQAKPGVFGSLFVEARVGESDFHGVWGGLKFYFGQRDKTLIARHRQDDPFDWEDTLFTLTNSFSRSVAAAIAAGPGIVCPPGEILIDGVCVTIPPI